MTDLFEQQGSVVDDPDYPELLRDLARIVEQELVNVGTDRAHAKAIAETVTEHVMEHHGGVPQYWPKGTHWRKLRRRREMWERFNGTNHAELARDFGMCLQQVYKWLAIERAELRKRTQRDMFETNPEAGLEAASNTHPQPE